MKRTCERVQGRLPRVVDGTLPGWQRRLVLRHVARCEDCSAELERQRTVAAGLRELSDAASGPDPDPPDELLDEILEQVHDPGVRERVAGPARGAVSGARPELSLTTLFLAALVAYLAWRVVRRLVNGSASRFDPTGLTPGRRATR